MGGTAVYPNAIALVPQGIIDDVGFVGDYIDSVVDSLDFEEISLQLKRAFRYFIDDMGFVSHFRSSII
jgi:hypothetical protein